MKTRPAFYYLLALLIALPFLPAQAKPESEPEADAAATAEVKDAPDPEKKAGRKKEKKDRKKNAVPKLKVLGSGTLSSLPGDAEKPDGEKDKASDDGSGQDDEETSKDASDKGDR